MKNLKRVLSLALSGIMLVGMMAMSASAVNAEDFTDSDEITHTEAVSISTALKIIDGKDDGTFDPNGSVTRGQMAKMITRAMFGGEDPVLGVKTEPTFTDIKGRWDESYIEYCASNGIINGRGDGTFDPEGNVTGTEAAKMLLTALGYKADIYGLTGPDWAITTNSIANATDVALYADLKGLDPTQAFTRDQVAQMIYNALNAETMKMEPNMSITNGEVTYQYSGSGKSLLTDKYGAYRVEATVVNNEFSNNASNMVGKTNVQINNTAELAALGTLTNPVNLEVSTGKDEIGRAVIIYVKPSTSNPGNLGKGTVISDVIVSDINEIITTAGRLSGSAHTLASWIDNNGLEFSKDSSNVINAVMRTNYATGVTITTASADAEKNENLGTEYIAIDNDGDGEVEVVLKNTSSFGKVTKWDEKNEKVTVAPNLVPNADMDDVVAYDGIAKNDFVNVTKVDDTYYVTKAETVEGELEKRKGSAARDTIVVDGETYTLTGKQTGGAFPSDTEVKDITTLNTTSLDEQITLYLDAFGYVVGFSSETAKEYLFVGNASWSNTASSQNSGALTAYVYFEDGTSGSYTVDSITDDTNCGYGTTERDPKQDDAESTTSANRVVGKVWKYSMSDNKLNLFSVANTAQGTSDQTVEYNKGDMTVEVNGSGLSRYIVDDTVVFFVTLKNGTARVPSGPTAAATDWAIDKVTVYTGKTAPSMDFHVAADGLYKAPSSAAAGTFGPALVTVNADDSTTTYGAAVFANDVASGSDWLYVIEYITHNSTGCIYRAIVDGEVVELQSDKGFNTTNTGIKNALFDYSVNDKDVYSLTATNTSSYVKDFVSDLDGNRLVVGGTELKITNDTIIALIDGGDTYTGADVSENDYVIAIKNADNEAEGIFVLTEADSSDTGIVDADSTKLVASPSAGYDYKIDDDVVTTNAILEAIFKTQVGAEVRFTTTAPTAGAAISALPADASVTPAAGTDIYMIVIAEGAATTSTTDYSVYKIEVMSST